MKRFSFVALIASFMLFGVSENVFSQTKFNYTKAWKDVEAFVSKDKPQSALSGVDKIFRQAQKEGNVVQTIKARASYLQIRYAFSPDSMTTIIQRVEAEVASSNNELEKMLSRAMLADWYWQYYDNSRWSIDRRSEMTGEAPADIKEWTRRQFIEKIFSLVNNVMSNPEMLKTLSATDFEEILNFDEEYHYDDEYEFEDYDDEYESEDYEDEYYDYEDGLQLQRTLYELVQWFRIETLYKLIDNRDYLFQRDVDLDEPISLNDISSKVISSVIIKYYADLIDFCTKRDYLQGAVYADLSLAKRQSVSELEYLEECDKLEEKYADKDVLVEIWNEKANVLRMIAMRSIENKSKNINNKKAYDIAIKGISKFPQYVRIGLLKRIKYSCEKRSISTEISKFTPANSTLKFEVETQNIKNIKISVYNVELEGSVLNLYKNGYINFFKNTNLKTSTKPIFETEKRVEYNNIIDFASTKIEIPTYDYGIYKVIISSKDKDERGGINTEAYFITTDFSLIDRSATFNHELPKKYDIGEFYVINRTTGEPYNDVTAKFYEMKRDGNKYVFEYKDEGKCGDDFKYLSKGENIIVLERGNDKYFSKRIGYNYYSGAEESKREVSVSLFSDRSLYRPSQTVKFKGIAYIADKNSESVVPNHALKVFLRNAKYETIDSVALTTNEFGSFSGEFTLPKSGLNGECTIYSQNGFLTFKVEEYKRPTFMAEIEKSADEIKFGEEVKLKGSAISYAGYAMQDAKVKYRISRRVYSSYYWEFLYSEPVTITTGETITDSQGRFEFAFTPEKSDLDRVSLYNGEGIYYIYIIEADITDKKGETQQCYQSLYVSDKPLYIKIDVGNQINYTELLKIKVSAENINGVKKSVSGDYALIALETDAYYEELSENRYLFYSIPNSKSEFKEKNTVRYGKFSTEKEEMALDIKNLKSGFYLFRFSAIDSRGNDVVGEKRILLSSSNDKKPPVKTYFWSNVEKTELNVGESTKIRFGTTEKNAYALYEILIGNKVIESSWMKLSDEIKDFEVEMKEAYGDGFTLQISMIRNEKFFNRKFEIKKKREDKTLKPKLTVFRDKLRPCEEAEWTVQVPNPTNTPKKVELLIGMYDYSLNAIQTHNWNFSPNYVPRLRHVPYWYNTSILETSERSASDIYTIKYIPLFNFYQFDFGYIYSYESTVKKLRSSKESSLLPPLSESIGQLETSIYEYSSQSDLIMALSGELVGLQSNISDEDAVSGSLLNTVEAKVEMDRKKGKGYAGAAATTVSVENVPDIKARENFDETTFFYPHIVADNNGEAKFSFKMPESLTRWRLQILAHTQDLYTGKAEAFVFTQQELMIQMNLPRFVRRSDRLKLNATVTNMTDLPISPKAMLEIINPKSDEVVLRIPAQLSEIAANSTQSIGWELPELKDYDLLIFKAVAYTEQFQDGEQKYLPILPDRVLVTEAMPIRTGRGGAENSFRFDSFIRKNSSVETLRYKVEYSSNPIWYAVQALASMSEANGENAIAYLTAYYANSMGNFIAKSNPKIKANVDKWITEDTTELISQLQKYPELQNVPISETTWSRQVQDEAFRKQQLFKLLDDVYSKNTADEILEKLLALQTSNGGFAWLAGMHENWYVTSVVVENLWKLSQLTGCNLNVKNELSESIKKACNYLDDEFVKDFENLKYYNKNYQKIKSVPSYVLRYLYLRANLTEFPRDKKTTKAWVFYTERAYRYWTNFGLYERAMTISLAKKEGKTSVAKSIAESLKEHSQQTDEMGMYWERNTAGYFWQERPIMVQTAIIEAFREVYGDCSDVEEMKIWLLKQKQTQSWDSPISTANAVYALLLYGNKLINDEPNVLIYAGEKMIENTKQTSGIGYFSHEFDRKELNSDMGTIRVKSNQKSGTSWGAVYWQFFEDMSQTEQGKGELSITKELYVEQMVNGKRTLVPISKVKLKKGDKVVSRMTVRTSRDLEFVSIRDLRAACFEPVEQISRMVYREGVGYYQSSKDSSTEIFFDNMPKGTYVFEYDLWVNNSGIYNSGMAEIQCQYAPEFTSFSKGEKVEVE